MRNILMVTWWKKDNFLSIGEIEKDLELYELLQDLQPFLGEGDDLSSCQSTKNGEPSLRERHRVDLFGQENEVHPNHQLLKWINLRIRFALNL